MPNKRMAGRAHIPGISPVCRFGCRISAPGPGCQEAAGLGEQGGGARREPNPTGLQGLGDPALPKRRNGGEARRTAQNRAVEGHGARIGIEAPMGDLPPPGIDGEAPAPRPGDDLGMVDLEIDPVLPALAEPRHTERPVAALRRARGEGREQSVVEIVPAGDDIDHLRPGNPRHRGACHARELGGTKKDQTPHRLLWGPAHGLKGHPRAQRVRKEMNPAPRIDRGNLRDQAAESLPRHERTVVDSGRNRSGAHAAGPRCGMSARSSRGRWPDHRRDSFR